MLAMAVEGGLKVRVEAAASFQGGAGRARVRYAGLAAWDADGRELASWLEASEGELRVLVEAGEARFPITVDPTFVQEAKLAGHGDPVGVPGAEQHLFASGGAVSEQFGYSLPIWRRRPHRGQTAILREL